LYENLLGHVLDDETKKKLNELELLIPENFKPDFYSQMTTQKTETIENMKKNGNIDKMIQTIQSSDKTQKSFENFFNNLLPYAIKDSKSVDVVKEPDYDYSDESDIEELKKDGWVDFEDWNEEGGIDTSMTLGNRVFIKIKK
jgi:hypothetical protein